MHFEFLVEDASGKILLESVIKKILGSNGAAHTYRFHSYKGVGTIPKGMTWASMATRFAMTFAAQPG